MFILVCQGRMRPSTFPIHNFYLRHGRPGDQSPGPGRVTPDCPREVAAGSWTQKLKLNFSVPFYSLERNDASDPGRILLMSEVWAAQTCWAWGRQRPWSTSSCPVEHVVMSSMHGVLSRTRWVHTRSWHKSHGSMAARPTVVGHRDRCQCSEPPGTLGSLATGQPLPMARTSPGPSSTQPSVSHPSNRSPV